MSVEQIRPVIESDYDSIAEWYRDHGETPPPRDWYGDGRGYIVPGAAAGWLYIASSTRAYAEDFVTCPCATVPDRHAAIVAIGRHIVSVARELGVRYVLGYTRATGVAAASCRAGFAAHPSRFTCLVAKEMSWEE